MNCWGGISDVVSLVVDICGVCLMSDGMDSCMVIGFYDVVYVLIFYGMVVGMVVDCLF